MKHCCTCRQLLPIVMFGKDKGRPDGFTINCKTCRRIHSRKFYLKHKAKILAYRRHKWARTVAKKFGITPEEYLRLLSEQGNVCAICGEASTQRALAVDHNHTTKQVRSLLCLRCNTTLGAVAEDVELLQNMIAYLKKWKSKPDGQGSNTVLGHRDAA